MIPYKVQIFRTLSDHCESVGENLTLFPCFTEENLVQWTKFVAQVFLFLLGVSAQRKNCRLWGSDIADLNEDTALYLEK
jgi:hypothetical protein